MRRIFNIILLAVTLLGSSAGAVSLRDRVEVLLLNLRVEYFGQRSKYAYGPVTVTLVDTFRSREIRHDAADLEGAARAAALAWTNLHPRDPVHIRIFLVPKIPKVLSGTDSTALFEIDRRLILIDSNSSARLTRLDPGPNLVLLAAHEATHQAQLARDGMLRPTDLLTYDDDPDEHEAWINAVRVLKMIYPTATGEVHRRRFAYPVPEERFEIEGEIFVPPGSFRDLSKDCGATLEGVGEGQNPTQG